MSNAIFSEFRDSEFVKKQCFGFNDAFSIQNADIGLLTNDYLKFEFVENSQTKKLFIEALTCWRSNGYVGVSSKSST